MRSIDKQKALSRDCIYKIEVQCSSKNTVLPAKSDSDFMFCLQSYQGLIIDTSLVY